MKLVIGVAFAALLFAAQLNAQDFYLGVTGRFDDNRGFSRASSDIVEDFSVRADGHLYWRHTFDVRTSVDVQTNLSLTHYLRTEDFDSATLDMGLALNRKIGLGSGLTRPLLTLKGNLGWHYSQEKFRAGIPYNIGVSGRSRLANQAILSYRLNWSGFDPDVLYRVPVGVSQRGDAWRWQMTELGTSYAVQLGRHWGVSVDLALFDGNLVFSTTPTPVLNNFAQARAPDHALGAMNYAYRVEGEAWQGKLGLAFIPQPDRRIQLTIGRLYSRSEAGFGYDRTWLEITWGKEF